MIGAIAAFAILAIGGGYWYWHSHTNDEAGGLLGIGMSIAQAPIVPPPTVPGATQAAGTYPTEQARQQAALQAFQQVVAQYPSTQAGLTARYQMGVALLTLGRMPEAEQAFAAVADQAGPSIYGAMARLAKAQAQASQAKYDDAIKALTDLAAQRDGVLPVDGVLMQLARDVPQGRQDAGSARGVQTRRGRIPRFRLRRGRPATTHRPGLMSCGCSHHRSL